MKFNFLKFLPCIAIFFLSSCIVKNKNKSQEQLSLHIVPTSATQPGDAEKILNLSTGNYHFHVVLTNNSQKPQRLFKEWNSWGYFALSFEIDGQIVRKKGVDWGENYAEYHTIFPQEHIVFNVNFSTDTWENSPLLDNKFPKKIKMRAIYEVEEDEESRQFKVWTGKIMSKEDIYTIY